MYTEHCLPVCVQDLFADLYPAGGHLNALDIGCNAGVGHIQHILYVKVLKDLLFVSNHVTQYFSYVFLLSSN